MDGIQMAAMMLGASTLAFLIVAFFIWRKRQDDGQPRAPKLPKPPKAPREPGESRLPKMPRRSREEEVPVEMSADRLARISRKSPIDSLSDDAAPDEAAAPIDEESRALATAMLSSMVAQVEQEADMIAARGSEPVVVRLAPQIPPRDGDHRSSWLGGRPRLPVGTAWPNILDEPANFLVQIDCAALPADLWEFKGPRIGWLAFFIHPREYRLHVLHVAALGDPLDPPHPLTDPDGWFSPHGGIRHGELMPFAVPAFPEWPVDLVAVHAGSDDPRHESDADNGMGYRLYLEGYDIAEPRHHPFDWPTMLAMVAILESQIEVFWKDLGDAPNPLHAQLGSVDQMLADWDGAPDDPDIQKLGHRRQALVELIAASDQARVANREARARVEEIIAIVRESANQDAFSPVDAAAVMTGLQQIQWMKVLRKADPEGRPGAELIETLTLPVTQHHRDAALWVHKYHSIWFDRAKHAYVADPATLSPDGRAFFEVYARELAAREMAGIGHVPFNYVHDFDESDDIMLLELPTSGLMSWMFGDVDNLVVTMRKPDLVAGDFEKLIVQASN